MWRTVRQVVAGLMILGLGATWATAEEKKKEGPLDTQAFVKKVGYINYAEIALGTLASSKSTREDVRQYGQRLAATHQKANQEMLQLAAKHNWVLAGAPDEKHRALGQKLAGLSGAEFDKEFLHHMVEGHKHAIHLFETQAKESKDADVKALAEKMLPTLREHLKQAEKLAGEKDKGEKNKDK